MVLALSLALAPWTAAADVHASWDDGLSAFQQQDYSGALRHFRTARDQGQPGPAVHYNIAVCEYKLGLHAQARNTFTLLRDDYPKMRALAEYNLGLTERKLGDSAAARRHFRSAYDASEPGDKLQLMATDMLIRTPVLAESPPAWSGSLGVRAGYDDNVALRDDLGLPGVVTTGSPTVDLFGSLQGPFSGRNGLRLDAMAYVVRYLDASEFDQSATQVGGYYDWQDDGWTAQLGIYGGYGTFSGDGFDRTGTGSVRIARRLTESASAEVRYRYVDVGAANSDFSGIEGSRQIFDARYRWSSGNRSIVLAYQFETNDRADPGVSPQRNRVGFDYRYRPESGWGFELGATLRKSDYNDLDPARTEDLTTLRAAISRMLGGEWLLLANYQFTNNESTDPVFSYRRNQFTVGLMRIF